MREHELGVDELDDEASDYILEDKLKKKFVAVFKKLCQLHKAESTTGRPTEKFFRYEGKVPPLPLGRRGSSFGSMLGY